MQWSEKCNCKYIYIFKNVFFENDLDVEKRVNVNIELTLTLINMSSFMFFKTPELQKNKHLTIK